MNHNIKYFPDLWGGRSEQMSFYKMLLIIVRFLRDDRGKAGIGTAPHGAGNA
jgi:hypothetical protein